MLKKLNRANAGVTTTRPVKVLQFGEGNFLRAFVDWIIDILNEKVDFNGDVQIIQPIGKGMGNMINDQEGLYHVVLNGIKKGKSSTETRLITCVRDVINPYEDFHRFLQAGENPDLKFIVSNTTEAGIAFNPADTNPDTLPDSFPGKLTSLLYHRFRFFNADPGKAPVIIPCELIDKNGEKLKETILQFAKLWDLPYTFKKWIEDYVIFCNTLVDRIVPGFPKEKIQDIQKEINYEDNLVVMAEPFHLWVIEAPESVRVQFPVEKAGLDVKFVKSQAPYRTRKVRILNGAHTALVPVAYLHGLRTVKESIENSFSGNFIRQAVFEEIIPTLDLPAEELKHFADDVIERFQNPFIKHELSSIALNSISKYKVRVLPSVLEYEKRKSSLPDHLVFSLACLIRFYKGTWKGETLPVADNPEIVEFFNKTWSSGDVGQVTSAVLSNTSFWDTDLTKVFGMTEKVSSMLNAIEDSQQIEKAWAAAAK